MHVTLKSLRENGACFEGYNKVVRSLQRKQFTSEDEERDSYIRYDHKEPISLISIVESNGFDDAIWALRCVPDCDRDVRLFAVWCARQVQHLMKDTRSIHALDVAERFANGVATENELKAAGAAARVAWAAEGAAREAAWAAEGAAREAAGAAWAAWAAEGAAREAARVAREAAWEAAGAAARAAREAAWAAWAAVGAARAAWEATWEAAWAAAVAARSAWEAWEAAWAAREAQKEMFIKMCKGEAPWQIKVKDCYENNHL